ncbi:MAG TPA: type II toxin-antitoxin system VapC family toxin [Rhodoblastus sp.]|nr:type II toxin-antitoxin system VapC family toxin [Rhodoblastus sp.]
MDFPDVNVLIYAFRPNSDRHEESRRWLETTLRNGAPFAVSTLVLSSVVRIVTNRRAVAEVSTLDDALGFCSDILQQPNVRLIEPGERHWPIFERLCRTTNLVGPVISDIFIAALAMEHDCTVITYDRDFLRFPGLRWRTPE